MSFHIYNISYNNLIYFIFLNWSFIILTQINLKGFMKVLYLVRHAKSSWDDPDLEDIARPLNGRGKSDAQAMGEKLLRQGIKPEILVSSPAKRTRSTAKSLAKKIGFPKENIRIADELYHGNMNQILEFLRGTPKETGSVMIFSHNPILTEFANALCGVNIYNIPTCGVVAIEFDIREWALLEYNKGKLVFFDYPKKPGEG